MDLKNSTEPLRQIAVVVTAVLVAVGAALTSLAGSVDWSWIAPASTAIGIAVGIIGHWVGIEKGRATVWPDQKIQAFLTHAQATEPGPAALTPEVAAHADPVEPAPSTSVEDAPPISLADIEAAAESHATQP